MRGIIRRLPPLVVLLLASASAAAGGLDASASAADAAVQVASESTGWKGWVRSCVDCDDDRQRYSLHMDRAWDAAPAEAAVVVLVHGFNSRPENARLLIAGAREAGLACGEFAYPNDQPLRASAELLSRELHALASSRPDRRVALVTHSMGGLIARECIEDDALNPGNVERLIMVAPPTNGSSLARYAIGLDVWEHWISRRRGAPWERLRDSIADGLSEAPADLRPGSPFLTRLNSRPRRDGVTYTLLLGASAQVSEEQRYLLHRALSLASKNPPAASADAEPMHHLLAGCEELMDGLGDGAVSVTRGRLDGVEDTHVLPFSHLGVVRTEGGEGSAVARRLILERLLDPGAGAGDG